MKGIFQDLALHVTNFKGIVSRFNGHLAMTGRLCLVCKSLDCVEDEQHFDFDCPAYNHIRSQHLDLLQHCCTIADFMTLCEPNACGGFLRECFVCRKQILFV